MAMTLDRKITSDQEFSRLLEHNRNRCSALSRKLAGEDWQDLLQDAYTKAWERRATYNNDFPFLNWLMKLIENTNISRYRNARSRVLSQALCIEGMEEVIVADDAHSPYNAGVVVDFRRRLELALSSLSSVQRQAILRVAAGESYEDIAKDLNLLPQSMRGFMYIARKKLREILATHE